MEKLKKFITLVPSLSEQRAIADYLDRKCAEIDELIAIKQQKIEALKEYKKSVIFEYVTGKKEVL
jgi:type I restriction enzyme S subunit